MALKNRIARPEEIAATHLSLSKVACQTYNMSPEVFTPSVLAVYLRETEAGYDVRVLPVNEEIFRGGESKQSISNLIDHFLNLKDGNLIAPDAVAIIARTRRNRKDFSDGYIPNGQDHPATDDSVMVSLVSDITEITRSFPIDQKSGKCAFSAPQKLDVLMLDEPTLSKQERPSLH